MKAAKAAGAITSFDLNYRAKLWNIWGGRTGAVAVIARIVENVDVLVGNEEDLQMGSAFPDRRWREIEARPERILRHDRRGDEEAPAGQDRRDHAARSPLDEPPQLECGGLDRRQDLSGADSRTRCSTIAWAAAMATRRASSTVCWRAKTRKTRSGWAGRTALC